MKQKTYEVTGTTAYLGHQPGEQFKAALDEAREQRAVARGSIRVVTTKTSEKEASET